ncbi:MAG: hypothetical protein SGJ21_00725 [Alphaproteobacteria bacterium]|nr:hypothetical protein [Alphaproteobacteria bacterium]
MSQDAKNRKQPEAAELLPLITAELERRAGLKAEAAVERKKATATKRASTRATKLSEKAALESEEASD